ncbi:MAG: nucleotidyl transferase AbiEii/AbiGii toxin family protein [Sediminibacterium sp.]|uniref:nucleotidyl transferase AbiEii/AbiGii toxin family protein n=1 Tax=Sediminibacterium sp. TaxID=1917865 RepID=UPI00271999F0|nr:nucleotidyl transferase AbiEii/AbiGii toxin family protein [Sediminibacterium sp.]MDO8997444.1 nucleotidyl transferase AbiEii/AbiGii toxin family protein [Sediminibacterium sp.]
MIPQAYITEWSNQVPWQTNEQVEQDLVICRALVEIFSDEFLATSLAFRGGTALHKLYLSPQPRYSEDIDLVQITAEPFGIIADRLREKLVFLGEPKIKQKENNFTLQYRFESEFPPIQNLLLKVETNCREHFSVLGYQQFPFQIKSSWFSGDCNITTYQIEELLGTKLRALYQRRKGRDLYDLYKALTQMPKMNNDEFIGDIKALIRPTEQYNQTAAFELVREQLLMIIDSTWILRSKFTIITVQSLPPVGRC